MDLYSTPKRRVCKICNGLIKPNTLAVRLEMAYRKKPITVHFHCECLGKSLDKLEYQGFKKMKKNEVIFVGGEIDGVRSSRFVPPRLTVTTKAADDSVICHEVYTQRDIGGPNKTHSYMLLEDLTDDEGFELLLAGYHRR